MNETLTINDQEAADDQEATVDGGIRQLGRTIRRLRRERGLSLQKLADLSEMSVGMLSHIERGVSSPSLKSLTRIRLALEVPLSSLFEDDMDQSVKKSYVRLREQRPRLDLGSQYLLKELLSPSTAKDLEFMILHIPPGGGSGEVPFTSEGEKAGFVMEGSLRVEIGNDTVDLREGDSIQFDSSIPHRFYNADNATARVLWIIVQLPHRSQL